MKKILLLLIFTTLITSCSYTQENVNLLIYKTFFKDIVRVSIIKATISKIAEIDSSDQLAIIKNEMKNITILKKYTTNPNYGGVFKTENFRLMHVITKIGNGKHKVLELLYSTKDAIMIAREGDIFPDKKPKTFEEKISVYEFEIPQRVNTFLKQCENKLPKEGFFFNTWSDPFI